MTDMLPIARAHATPDAICVEVPTSTGTPYTCRYPKTVAGLAAALNILIEHSAPTRFQVTDHPIINSKLAKPAQGSPESRKAAADIVRSMFK